MTAKDHQIQIVKEYFKPALKGKGYKTTGQMWWKEEEQFYILINWQNSQWNSKDNVSFCFNIGIALKEKIEPKGRNPKYADIIGVLREAVFLPEERRNHIYRKGSGLGYLITNETNTNDFIRELNKDLENHIYPALDRLKTIDDCIAFYRQFDFLYVTNPYLDKYKQAH